MANPIESDFKLALALGRLAGRWGQAELMVELIYIALSEMPARKATISFSFHKAVATQNDIISLLADETDWLTDDERTEIKGAVKDFSSKSGQRNGWVHYPFGIDSNSPDAAIYKAKRSRKGDSLYSKEPASAELIRAFADQISTLVARLSAAHSTAQQASARKLKLQPLGPTPLTWSLSIPSSQGLLGGLLSQHLSSDP